MKKNKVYIELFSKRYDGERDKIPFGDLPKDLLDTDDISIHTDPGYYSENNSWDSFTELKVFRQREETDEECNKRFLKQAELKAQSRTNRYNNYLQLKKEFENE